MSTMAPPPRAATENDRPPTYHGAPPDEPPPAYDPPSYEDATRSSSAPLMVGPGVDYGTVGAYRDLEAASDASSDLDDSFRSLPEWVGQCLVVMMFLAIIFGFWEFIHSDGEWPDHPG